MSYVIPNQATVNRRAGHGRRCALGLGRESSVIPRPSRAAWLETGQGRPRCRRLVLGCVLMALAATGCLETTRAPRANALAERVGLKPIVPGPNDVVMYFIFLERPLGDRVINQDLWASADEQQLELALRHTLEQRGFHVGVLGGQLPDKLRTLFNEEELGRMNGERVQIQSGSPTRIETGGEHPTWPVTMPAGQPDRLLDCAVGSLRLVPTIAGEDAIDVRLTPEVQYGNPIQRFVPDDEPRGRLAGWTINVSRQLQSFEELTFSLRLRTGQFALLTCLAADGDSLGARFFTLPERPTRTQRAVLLWGEPAGMTHRGIAR